MCHEPAIGSPSEHVQPSLVATRSLVAADLTDGKYKSVPQEGSLIRSV